MIASLQGTVIDKGDSFFVVETGGVGFKVFVPAPLVARWGTLGKHVQLFTHLHIRENEVSLYGFETKKELVFFQSLLGVSGIGPKVALGALSAGHVETLRAAIAAGDSDALTQLPGVGKKTAQRIILDLRGKLEAAELAPVPPFSPADEDVIAALISMGYNDTEARATVASLPDEEMSVEDRLLLALRNLGGG
jgi:Holliday junction DNA helicase RuvA